MRRSTEGVRRKIQHDGRQKNDNYPLLDYFWDVESNSVLGAAVAWRDENVHKKSEEKEKKISEEKYSE